MELFFKWIKQKEEDKDLPGDFQKCGAHSDLDGDDLLSSPGLHQISD